MPFSCFSLITEKRTLLPNTASEDYLIKGLFVLSLKRMKKFIAFLYLCMPATMDFLFKSSMI